MVIKRLYFSPEVEVAELAGLCVLCQSHGNSQDYETDEDYVLS